MIRGIRNILSGVLIVGLLASCSSKLPNSDVPVRDAGKSGVMASGLGRHANFSRQEKGEVYTTQAPRNQIYLFAYDNAKVAAKYLPSINAQARYLQQHPGAFIMLAGHTDSRGSREYNIALGERRANAVEQLFRLAGVSRKQIRVVSYGQERPVAYNQDAASYRLNRRVELTYEALR